MGSAPDRSICRGGKAQRNVGKMHFAASRTEILDRLANLVSVGFVRLAFTALK
jgi:hypothetical protein